MGHKLCLDAEAALSLEPARRLVPAIAKSRSGVRETSVFARIEEAIEELRAGRMIVVVDDEDCENEGDLMMGPSGSLQKLSTSWPAMDEA